MEQKEKIRTLEEKLKKRNDEYSALESKLETLQWTLEDSLRRVAQYEQLVQQVDENRNKIESQHEELKFLQDELAVERESKSALEAQLDRTALSTIDQLKEELDNAHADAEAAEARHANEMEAVRLAANQADNRASGDIAAIKQEHNDTIATYDGIIGDLNTQVASLNASVESWRLKCNELEQSLRNERDSRRDTDVNIRLLEDRLTRSDKDCAEYKSREKQVSEEYTRTKHELSIIKAQYDSEKGYVSLYKQIVMSSEKMALQHMRSAMDAELKECQRHYQDEMRARIRLEEVLERSEATSKSQISTLQDTTRSQSSRIKTMESTISELTARLADADSIRARLTARLEASDVVVKDLKEQLSKNKKDYGTLVIKKNALELESVENRTKLNNMIEHKSKLEDDVDELKSTISNLKSRHADDIECQLDDKRQLQHTIDRLTSEFNALVSEVTNNKNLIEVLTQEKDTYVNSIKTRPVMKSNILEHSAESVEQNTVENVLDCSNEVSTQAPPPSTVEQSPVTPVSTVIEVDVSVLIDRISSLSNEIIDYKNKLNLQSTTPTVLPKFDDGVQVDLQCEKCACLEAANRTLKDAESVTNSTHKSLETQRDEALFRVKLYIDEIDEWERNYSELERTYQDVLVLIDKNKVDIDRYKRRIDELTKHVDTNDEYVQCDAVVVKEPSPAPVSTQSAPVSTQSAPAPSDVKQSEPESVDNSATVDQGALRTAKRTVSLLETLISPKSLDDTQADDSEDEQVSSPIRRHQLVPVERSVPMSDSSVSDDMYLAVKRRLQATETDKINLQNKLNTLIEAVKSERESFKLALANKDKKYKDRCVKYDEEIAASKERYSKLKTKYESLKKVMISSGVIVPVNTRDMAAASGYQSDQ